MTSPPPPPPDPVDPFDLPAWLGERDVTWVADGGVRDGHLVPGHLTGAGTPGDAAATDDADVPCDLVAVDEAFPGPVSDDATRAASHQAWRHGQVHLGTREGRLLLLVPGRGFDTDTVLDAVARLARAVGSDPERYAVLLRIGAAPPHQGSTRS